MGAVEHAESAGLLTVKVFSDVTRIRIYLSVWLRLSNTLAAFARSDVALEILRINRRLLDLQIILLVMNNPLD
jgi:hypothetical protein